MTDLAFTLLKKLLLDAEKNKAGVKVRNAAITMAALESYHSNRNIQDERLLKPICRRLKIMVQLTWRSGSGYLIDGRIERVDLTDLGKLALFLGILTGRTYCQKQELACLGS